MLDSSSLQLEDDEVPKFEQATAWRDKNAYPPLLSELEAADYLRIAWEVLRRMPLYRWHHWRLKRDGLLESDAFPGGRRFISSHDPARFAGWQGVVARLHLTAPAALRGEKLQSYVRRHTQNGEPWTVVHGHWYVKSAWGISHVPDPSAPADKLDLSQLFAPSRPTLFPVYAGRVQVSNSPPFFFPGRFSFDLLHREVLIRFRLDMPMVEQWALAQDGLDKVRSRLGFREPTGRNRVLELRAPLWLRMWDAEQDGADPKEAKWLLRKEYEKAALRLSDRRFAFAVANWVDSRYARIKSDGKAVIQGKQGGTFLTACLAAGISAIGEPDYFSPAWPTT
jgi:hypothetical protein